MVNPIFKLLSAAKAAKAATQRELQFKFKFRIGMHINDRPLLVYIRNRLGCLSSKIYPISIESILPKKDKLTSVWVIIDDVLKRINF